MILPGDCRTTLATLPAQSVQCCVTSPPYFGLRDYGTATWSGGDAECDHRQPLGGEGASSAKQNTSAGTQAMQYRDRCGKCDATRSDAQIGLEETPDAYVAELVAVFREVRRVLRDDGTLWLNLGDSYAGAGTLGRNDAGRDIGGRGGNILGSGNPGPQGRRMRAGNPDKNGGASNRDGCGGVSGLKAKDIIGIPWRVAFALQADGWYLRQDIIWHKPNPMPESVTDRCTKAHEYVFLLAKAERYYYDADAIREKGSGVVWNSARSTFAQPGEKKRDIIERQGIRTHGGDTFHADEDRIGRNRRSVWTVTSKPFAEAHFATFPPDLIEPCILAGSKRGDTVLDPFNGAGTTGVVAVRHGRDYIGCELNPAYIAMSERRIAAEAERVATPLFDRVPT